MRKLLKEDLGGGGETPFDITYFCGIATGDFVNTTKSDTGKLVGAVNEGDEFYDEGFDRTASHRKIKEDPEVFKDFLQHLNRVPPVVPTTITIDKASGRYDAPLTLTISIDPPDGKVVDCVAKKVTKEIRGGGGFPFEILDATSETLEETLNSGQTLTLPRGRWEVVFSAEGAAEDVKRTYWVGMSAIEVTILTDNSTPFDRSLVVTATTNSARARVFHSVDSIERSAGGRRLWNEEASVTITENAEVYFIAIDPDGVASEIVSKRFRKRPLFERSVMANVIEHFLGGRISANERSAYVRQFGLKPFTLYLVNGDWVLDPDQRIENPLPPTVIVSRDSGTYKEPLTVTLTARDKVDPSSKIHYTTDGSTPTTSSPVFTSLGQITFDTSGTKVLKFFAQNSSGKKSDVETRTYEMDVTDVRLVIKARDGDPQPGEYSGALTVAIEAVDARDAHVTVHYTLDGSVPDEDSPSFQDRNEFEISGNGNHVIACYAKDSGGNETHETFPYSIDDQKYPETGIAPSRGGTYADGIEITLTPSEHIEWTKYTSDGSIPDHDNGIPYTEPFTLVETASLKWRSKDVQGNIEPVNMTVFTITKELQEAVFGNDANKDGYIKANADGSRRSIGTLGSLPLGVGWDGKVNRPILHFDTASIPDNATITTAWLRVEHFSGWGDPWAGGNMLVVDIRTGYFGSSLSLQTDDWDDPATASAVATIDEFASGTNDSSGFSQEGLDAINRTGITQIRLRFDPNPSDTQYVRIKQGASAKLFVEYTA